MSSFFPSTQVSSQFEIDGPAAWAGMVSIAAMVVLSPSYLRVLSCVILSASIFGSVAYFGGAYPSPCELAMVYLAPSATAAVIFTALVTYSNQAWREESGKSSDPVTMLIDSISFILYIGGGGLLILSQVDWSWVVVPAHVVSAVESVSQTCEAHAAGLGLSKHTLPTLLASFAIAIGITATVCGRLLDIAIMPYHGARDGGREKDKEKSQ